MTPLPRVIHVGPFDFTVSCDIASITQAQSDERAGLYGSTDRKKARITLHPENAPSVQRETLMHEVLHTVTTVCAIDADMTAEDEERFVRRMAPVMLEVLRRNKGLVTYLTAP